jgi:signal transduction histidine kinase
VSDNLDRSPIIITGFADAIADRIASEHALLAARWFARLRDLLPVDAEEVFPSDRLLDHIPSLIVDISNYVKAPEEEAIAANTMVMEKARELGALRHEQRASLHQVLREYQLLGGILLRFVQDESIRLMLTPPPTECMAVVSRIHQAVEMLLQETVETFVGLYTQTITAQTERLKQFTRMATHEWRQPLAPIMSAVSLLRMPLSPAQHTQTVDMIARNAASLVDMTRKLERLARLDGESDNASVQEVSISTVAHEAARQLREMADARGVELRIADDMPALIVDVGRLELAFVNLLSNAIKYSDEAKTGRFVEISAAKIAGGKCEVYVRDNGVGIPAARIGVIFRRFARAHADQPAMESVSGVGLGLAIVDDCVEALQGTIGVESQEGVGTTFVLTLPCEQPRTASAADPLNAR